ncbi:transposase [Membranihabitans marinus]
MSEKFKGEYRIESARKINWNYAEVGCYFITICTVKHIPYFGYIKNGIMCLNELGSIVWNEWLKSPTLRPDMNISIGEFVVMPNHLHGILNIGDNEYNASNLVIATSYGPQCKNLPSIIRGFKSSVTIKARKINVDFAWQPRYHDHIIRTNKSYHKISNYIIDNPFKWNEDEYYIE